MARSEAMDSYTCDVCEQIVPVTNRVLHGLRCRYKEEKAPRDQTPKIDGKATKYNCENNPIDNCSNFQVEAELGCINAEQVQKPTVTTDHNTCSISLVDEDLWSCPVCTYLNTSHVSTCGACKLQPDLKSNLIANTWNCMHCTFLNPNNKSYCELCDSVRPADKVVKERLIHDDDDDEDDDVVHHINNQTTEVDSLLQSLNPVNWLGPKQPLACSSILFPINKLIPTRCRDNEVYVMSLSTMIGLSGGLLLSMKVSNYHRVTFPRELTIFAGAGVGALGALACIWLHRVWHWYDNNNIGR